MGNFLLFLRPRRVLCIIVGRAVGRMRTSHRRRAVPPAFFAAAAVLAIGIAGAFAIVIVIISIAVTTFVATAATFTFAIVGANIVAIVGGVAVPIARA